MPATFIQNALVEQGELLIPPDLALDLGTRGKFAELLGLQGDRVKGLQRLNVAQLLVQVADTLVDGPEDWVTVPVFFGDDGLLSALLWLSAVCLFSYTKIHALIIICYGHYNQEALLIFWNALGGPQSPEMRQPRRAAQTIRLPAPR